MGAGGRGNRVMRGGQDGGRGARVGGRDARAGSRGWRGGAWRPPAAPEAALALGAGRALAGDASRAAGRALQQQQQQQQPAAEAAVHTVEPSGGHTAGSSWRRRQAWRSRAVAGQAAAILPAAAAVGAGRVGCRAGALTLPGRRDDDSCLPGLAWALRAAATPACMPIW